MKNIVDMIALRNLLIERKTAVSAEIRNYPGPIPGCDAQFNHLLEVRRILSHELQRLDAMDDDDTVSVDEFITRSPSARELQRIFPLH